MEELIIKSTRPSDIPDIIEMELHPDNAPYICLSTEKEHKNMINDPNYSHMSLWNAYNELLGFYILKGTKTGFGELNLMRLIIKKKNQGLGKKAITRIKHFAFEESNYHRLSLDVFAHNFAAIHVYKTAGFHYEGKLEKSLYKNGILLDLCIFAIIHEKNLNSTTEFSHLG